MKVLLVHCFDSISMHIPVSCQHAVQISYSETRAAPGGEASPSPAQFSLSDRAVASKWLVEISFAWRADVHSAMTSSLHHSVWDYGRCEPGPAVPKHRNGLPRARHSWTNPNSMPVQEWCNSAGSGAALPVRGKKHAVVRLHSGTGNRFDGESLCFTGANQDLSKTPYKADGVDAGGRLAIVAGRQQESRRDRMDRPNSVDGVLTRGSLFVQVGV